MSVAKLLDPSQFDGHSPGPWKLWTSNSWRRYHDVNGRPVCEPTIQRSDNHPDLHFACGGFEGPDARLIEAAPMLLAEVKRLREAVRRLYQWGGTGGSYDGGITYAVRDWVDRGMSGPLPELPEWLTPTERAALEGKA